MRPVIVVVVVVVEAVELLRPAAEVKQRGV